MPAVQNLIDDVPLYVNAKEVVGIDGRPEALELNYLTFFAHNGPYSVAGFKAPVFSPFMSPVSVLGVSCWTALPYFCAPHERECSRVYDHLQHSNASSC